MEGNSAATLAEGEQVEQSFNKCDINVAGRDVVRGDKITTKIYVNSISLHQDFASSSFESDQCKPAPFQAQKGWVQLSDKICMKNQDPVRKGTKVYQGKQSVADGWRDVAIKLIPHNTNNVDEVKMLMDLEDHPNVVRFFESGEVLAITRQIYIVMEFCPKSLKEYVEENGQKKFNFEKAFTYSRQIVSGVAFIHDHNIIHRDLKLENILITRSMDCIRITDFGLSKRIDAGASVSSLSSPGLGSEGYRAPEMYNEKPEASFYSDTFALGIVLFALFSNGKHPFGANMYKWQSNIVENKERTFSDILQFEQPHAHKRKQLIGLLEMTLKHDPNMRPKPQLMLQHDFFTDNAPAHICYRKKFRRELTALERMKADEIIRQMVKDIESNVKLDVIPEKTGVDKTITDKYGATDNGPAYRTEGEQRVVPKLTRKFHTRLGRTRITKATDMGMEDLQKEIVQLKSELKRTPLSKEKLRMLLRLQTLTDSPNMDTYLQLAECEVFLNNGEEGKQMEALERICRNSSLQEVESFTKSVDENQHPLAAVIMYSISGELPSNGTPDDVIKRIAEHVVAICRVTGHTGVSPLGLIALQYAHQHTLVLLAMLRSIFHADDEAKTVNEAACLAKIANLYQQTRNSAKADEITREGLALLEERLGESAFKYKCYSWLLNNKGWTCRRSGNFNEAVEYFQNSIRAIETAVDYEDDESKSKARELATGNLRFCKMGSTATPDQPGYLGRLAKQQLEWKRKNEKR